jgi:acyl-coenzyme A synthetase/AMP-(fatty) acid ligase
MLHVFISAAGDDIRPGAVGRPVPGFRAVILDEDGNELGDNVPGRLAVRGPLGCRYLNDARQRNYVINGWNVTGDTFYRDEDGYFVYQSRSDNMIVSSGYNIGAPEVETAINEHPEVLECAVVAKPDETRGSLVTAFIVVREGIESRAGEGQGDPGLRQGADRTVQVPARDPLRRRAAEEPQRQAPALQTPRPAQTGNPAAHPRGGLSRTSLPETIRAGPCEFDTDR